MSYNHGIYVSQLPTAIIPPRRIDSAIPVVVGAAPVHMISEDETGPVNTPVLAYSYAEAVQALGYNDDWANYNLCEFMYSQFALYALAPVVFINVFDPAVHQTAVAAEEQTFSGGKITLAHAGLVSAPVVKSSDGETTYAAGTDYEVDLITGTISLTDESTIAADATVKVDYSYGDPSLIDADDIIGGVDAGTGAVSGLELVDQVFPRFRVLPGLILAPGWSHNPLVAAVMATKAANINSGHFHCFAVVDIDSSDAGVTKYSDAPAWKNTNNYVDNNMIVCWPKIELEDKEFWLSTQVAGRIGRTDADNGDIPFESPSNKLLEMNGLILAGGDEVVLGPDQGNYLNGQGIVTATNWIGGWRLWGNRTGAYPANTDVKDSFISIQRMFLWMGNEFVLTFWQKVDKPLNRRLIETIVDSYNIRLNGLTAREAILGGRVEFLRDENPDTELMDGAVTFHLYATPPPPAREINALLEWDVSYLSALFGS